MPCDACLHEESSYAHLYNSVYGMFAAERETYIRKTLAASRSYCLAHRRRISKNIHRMHAQEVLARVTPSCRLQAERADAADKALVQHRTKRLVHRILRHTYRPHTGRMFCRCLASISMPSPPTKKNEVNRE